MRAEIILQYKPPTTDEDGVRGKRIPDYREEVEVRTITELSNIAYSLLRRTQSDPTLESAENVNFSFI
jgi:hypothetical protein